MSRKSLITITLLISSGVSLAVFFYGRFDWAIGVFSGTLAGLGNFCLLHKQMSKAYNNTAKKGMLVLNFVGRYLFLALVFYGAYRFEAVDFLAFVGGFSLVHLSMGYESFMRLYRSANS